MEHKNYAYLPEDLLLQMLNKSQDTAKKLANNVAVNDGQVSSAREILEAKKFIRQLPDGDVTSSIMATDGANIIDRKTGSDVILAIAVGIDGLSDDPSARWPANARQYQSWQDALPHHVANPRLAQGIMFLMELSILSENDRVIKIMDGSHLTVILKLNSLLSANDSDAADMPYIRSLSDFLEENYDKVIPDIPNIIKDAFTATSIISLTKYSSSREIIDSLLHGLDIMADDKIFMSDVLRAGEYTKPTPVGQSQKDRRLWKDIHISCNLEIEGVDNKNDMNPLLEEAISHFKIENRKDSELHFCYYKPYEYISPCRLEIKKDLADNVGRLEMFLRSVKNQIISPEIREPYPQYLADVIAKNIHFGMEAVNQAIYNDPFLNEQKNFDLIFPYRT